MRKIRETGEGNSRRGGNTEGAIEEKELKRIQEKEGRKDEEGDRMSSSHFLVFFLSNEAVN